MSSTEVLRLLQRTDPARQLLDRKVVEAAVHRHLAALRLPSMRLRWWNDLESACKAAEGRSLSQEWLVEEADAWYAACRALGFGTDIAWVDGITPIETGVRSAASLAAWRREDRVVLDTARRPSSDPHEPARAVNANGLLRRMARDNGKRILESTWTPGTALAGRLQGPGGAQNRATRFEVWRAARLEDLTGAAAAEEALVWIAAAEQLDTVPAAVSRMIEIWSPLLDAFGAGLWAYFFLSDEVLLVPRARVHLRREQLHAEHGPAICWPDGPSRWFWNGVEVDRHVVEEPSLITTEEILAERNSEVRRVLIERYTPGRFLEDVKAAPIHQDPFGTLYRFTVLDREPLVMVKLLNSTPEPDGSRKVYLLRVPPDMTTAHAAVAWTFGLRPEEYQPQIET